jgi:signal transduction histidine kinase
METNPASLFFKKIKFFSQSQMDNLSRILKRERTKHENEESVNVTSLFRVIDRQQAMIDAMLDGEEGLLPHIRRLDSYRALGLKGLSMMATGHEMNGLMDRLKFHVKAAGQQLEPLHKDLNRLEEIFIGQLGTHGVCQPKMDKTNLKEFITGSFGYHYKKEITFSDSFDNDTVQTYMPTATGFTVLSNLIRNALFFGNHVEILWTDDNKIVVSDDGDGVPKDKQHLLFSLGFSERRGGNGVGLLMCREYAIESQCQLYFDPDNQYTHLKGASFVLDLGDRIWQKEAGE